MSDVANLDTLPTRAKSTSTTFLPASSSCMSFCPFNSNFFVVGTYTLDKPSDNSQNEQEDARSGPQSRQGSLISLRLKEDLSTEICNTTSVDGGALDLAFCPHDPHSLAVATSTGKLVLLTLDKNLQLQLVHNIEVYSDGVLALFLSWHPHASRASLIAITGSDGSVLVFDSRARSILARLDTAHSLEAWTVVWKGSNEDPESWGLFSGGDDSTISQLDLQLEGNEAEISTKIFDRKTHGAGVTAILPLGAFDQDLILTGSYDDRLRLLRPRFARWQCLAEIDLGGGVWRLKLLNSSSEPKRLVILASCMYAGARIVEIVHNSHKDWTMRVLAVFEEHESMNYASDALVNQSSKHLSATVVSTSFYDKRLCVWQWQDV